MDVDAEGVRLVVVVEDVHIPYNARILNGVHARRFSVFILDSDASGDVETEVVYHCVGYDFHNYSLNEGFCFST